MKKKDIKFVPKYNYEHNEYSHHIHHHVSAGFLHGNSDLS